MRRGTAAAAALSTIVVIGSAAFAQPKPACGPEGRVLTPQKVTGQVVKVDPGRNILTVRENDGTVHEFQASKEALEGFKAGDKISASLREAPKCP
ncbi:MAG TPA: hypothetical protein VFL90_05670 [Methylomirabilota bacterium]|nr:hypothetical protein [Methylomirabilota bacterium]